MNSQRERDLKRISNMAGLDEEGGILPPSSDANIDRTPSKWWRVRDYSHDNGKSE